MKVYVLCFRPPQRQYTNVINAYAKIEDAKERFRETLIWALETYEDWNTFSMDEIIKDFVDDYGNNLDECIHNHSVEYHGFSIYIDEVDVVE